MLTNTSVLLVMSIITAMPSTNVLKAWDFLICADEHMVYVVERKPEYNWN